MKIKIDSTGRIAIPKSLQKRFGLKPGTILELEERPESLGFLLAKRDGSPVRRNGMWVYDGKAPCNFRWDKMIDDMRDERIEEILGHAIK